MKTRTLALIVLLGAAWACGGSSTSESSAPATSDPGNATPPSAPRVSDAVDKKIVDTCAGFNAAKAAEMLGVPEAELEVSERWAERLNGQQCRYWSKASRIGPGIEILLNVQESSAAAQRILSGQRSVVPVVDTVPERGPALLEFSGIGEEAFWDTNTGGVVLRVRNIVGTVHASLSKEPSSDRDQTQIDLERRVAEEIAKALSS